MRILATCCRLIEDTRLTIISFNREHRIKKSPTRVPLRNSGRASREVFCPSNCCCSTLVFRQKARCFSATLLDTFTSSGWVLWSRQSPSQWVTRNFDAGKGGRKNCSIRHLDSHFPCQRNYISIPCVNHCQQISSFILGISVHSCHEKATNLHIHEILDNLQPLMEAGILMKIYWLWWVKLNRKIANN